MAIESSHRFGRTLRADAYYASLAEIPWDRYYAKGIRRALVDIDNTLAVHGRAESQAYAQAQVERIEAAGIGVTLLSNAMPERAASFAESLGGIDVIGYAKKPSARGIDDALKRYQLEKAACLLVGDQLLTDVWAGGRGGVTTIRVDPIDRREPWWIRLKRLIEAILKRPLGYAHYYDHVLDREP